MTGDFRQSPEPEALGTDDRDEDAGASSHDGRRGLCQVCLLLLVCLHPELANLLML